MEEIIVLADNIKETSELEETAEMLAQLAEMAMELVCLIGTEKEVAQRGRPRQPTYQSTENVDGAASLSCSIAARRPTGCQSVGWAE